MTLRILKSPLLLLLLSPLPPAAETALIFSHHQSVCLSEWLAFESDKKNKQRADDRKKYEEFGKNPIGRFRKKLWNITESFTVMVLSCKNALCISSSHWLAPSAASIEIEDVSHKAPCRLHFPNSYGTECPSYEKVLSLSEAKWEEEGETTS